MNEAKSLREKLSLLAIVGEILIGIGCTWLILHHYYSLAEGATLLSVAGVLLVLVVACFGLHFFISGKTKAFKVAGCFAWIVLTLLETALAATVWMGTQYTQKVTATKAEIATKEKELSLERSKDARQELRADLAELRKVKDAPAFGDDSPEWKWLHARGIHVLPFPFGFGGMVILLIAGVAKAKDEEEAEKQSRLVVSAGQPKTVGFTPALTQAKSDPKETGLAE